MKKQWLQLAARYDALQVRERWLVAAAILGGIVLAGYSLFVEPALKRSHLAQRNAGEYRTQLSALQVQTAALQSPDRHPDVVARAELTRLKAQLAELAGRLQAVEGALVPPQRMPDLLEDMIGHKTGLRLVSLKTLPVAPVLDKKTSAGGNETAKPAETSASKEVQASSGLFKHGVEIKLEGSYQELTDYLARLEQSGAKLLWSSVALSAEKHPKLVLTLTVYTLSLDRAWLIV